MIKHKQTFFGVHEYEINGEAAKETGLAVDTRPVYTAVASEALLEEINREYDTDFPVDVLNEPVFIQQHTVTFEPGEPIRVTVVINGTIYAGLPVKTRAFFTYDGRGNEQWSLPEAPRLRRDVVPPRFQQ